MQFGNYECWHWFNEQFPCFVQKHPALQTLRDRVFTRRVEPRHYSDVIIFGIGRVCIEDFEQILNLCGNGFGIGAMQILRGMYERQVAAAYFSEHPEKVDAFVEYNYVHTRRLVNQFKEVYKDAPEILNGIVSEEEQQKIEDNYEAIRKNFLKTKCKKCETSEVMFSWSKLNPAEMALDSKQPALKDFFPYQYTRPLLLAHNTFKSVEARVIEKDDGSFAFESEGQRKFIKESLVNAHHLLLHVLDLQNDHFKLGLDDDIKNREKDYLECWAPNEAQPDSEVKVERASPAETQPRKGSKENSAGKWKL